MPFATTVPARGFCETTEPFATLSSKPSLSCPTTRPASTIACSASDFVKSTIAGTGTVSGPLATVTLTLLPGRDGRPDEDVLGEDRADLLIRRLAG